MQRSASAHELLSERLLSALWDAEETEEDENYIGGSTGIHPNPRFLENFLR